jgi:WD40 repeat protein
VGHYDPPPAEDEGLTSCIVSSRGRFILAGHADSGIQVWDLLKAEHIGVLNGHESRVTSLTISENGIAIGSSSWDQNVRIWT